MTHQESLEIEKQLVQFEQQKTRALIQTKARFSHESAMEHLKYQHDLTYIEERALSPKEFQKICTLLQQLSSKIVFPNQLLSVWENYIQANEPWLVCSCPRQQEAQVLVERFVNILSEEWEKRSLTQWCKTPLYQQVINDRALNIQVGESLHSINLVYDSQYKPVHIRYYMTLNNENQLSLTLCLLTLYHKRKNQIAGSYSTLMTCQTLEEALSRSLSHAEKVLSQYQETFV